MRNASAFLAALEFHLGHSERVEHCASLLFTMFGRLDYTWEHLTADVKGLYRERAKTLLRELDAARLSNQARDNSQAESAH